MSSMQYVVFSLGEEEFGIAIDFAQEIIRVPEQITHMPNMPSFIEGIVNLRGKIIPVIDLKKRFSFEQTERSVDSRLLVLDLENTLLGTIVDDVSEVLRIEDQAIEKLTYELSSIGSSSIQGIGKINDRLILLLDALGMKAEVMQN
ncbi:MAG: chemotaxis protein CheW [Chitinophagales bacterium]